MKLCDACHRHVRPTEGACPFCGRSLRTTAAARLGAVVLLGALETACSSRPVEDETASDTATPNVSTSEGDTSTSTTTTTSTTSATISTTSTSETTTPGTSSSGELSTTADIDTTDTGCSFYGGCPADFANPFECDPFVQDCPEGQKCSPQKSDGLSFDATACVPVVREPDQPGEPCTLEGTLGSGIDSCAVGSTCWEIDEQTLAGTCFALCGGTPDAPECAADTTCVSFSDALNLCVPTCDPLAPACKTGDVCVPNPSAPDGQFACVIDVSQDGGAEFEPCEFLNACDLGLACLDSTSATECDPMGIGCCVAYCDLAAPTCTGAGAECLPWFDEGQAPSGLEDVGVCSLPP